MVRIEFSTDNAAFEYPFEEIARILRQLADAAEHGIGHRIIKDINGNTIGSYTYTED